MEVYLVDGREVALTTSKAPVCDGGPGGHPVEYLTLGASGETRCKYCDRRFLALDHPEAAAARRGEKIEG